MPALSTAEVALPGVASEIGARDSAMVAATGDEVAPSNEGITDEVAANWFWELLAQSGYELW